MNIDRIEIGASEASKPLGLSQYETPLRFYARLQAQADPPEETPAMWLGKKLEPALAAMFEEIHEVKLTKARTLYHPRAPWLRASMDYFFRAEDAQPKMREEMQLDDGEIVPVELKAVNVLGFGDWWRERLDYTWGEPGSDHIPPEYATQVQTQILTTNAALALFGEGYCTRGLVFALIGGRPTPETFRVIGRPEIHDFIFDSLRRFVEYHLAKDVPPDPIDLEDWGLVEEMVRKPMRGKVKRYANAHEMQYVMAYRMAKATLEQAKIFEAQARSQLIEIITTGGGPNNYGLEGEWGDVIYTAGRMLPRTQKAAAFDAILALAEKRAGDPLADSIIEIRDLFTKPGYTGRQLRAHWADEKKGKRNDDDDNNG
jgi:hypothetical protein